MPVVDIDATIVCEELTSGSSVEVLVPGASVQGDSIFLSTCGQSWFMESYFIGELLVFGEEYDGKYVESYFVGESVIEGGSKLSLVMDCVVQVNSIFVGSCLMYDMLEFDVEIAVNKSLGADVTRNFPVDANVARQLNLGVEL